jgi:uncharacterized protein (TIGR00369 family)
MADDVDFETLARALTVGGADLLPGRLGLEVVELGSGVARLRCEIRPHHLAPNGYLHAGSVVSLADTAAGYGCLANLPAGASGFTTIEMKTNFIGTLLEGAIAATASLVHGGRTTHVWDAEVTDEATGRVLAAFRCTQLILYPKA